MTTVKHTSSIPIAIGGLGGSGTRVLSQMLSCLNIYRGAFINQTQDNTLFTQLFKSPQWYTHCNREDILHRLELFEKYMTGQRYSLPEFKEVVSAAHHNETHPKRYRFYLKLGLQQLFRPTTAPERWGWKEPHTHIFLPYLTEYFKTIKYIHVIRHGLDMAYTENTQQLFYWGNLFDLSAPQDNQELPTRQLNFWIKANRRAIQIGKSHLQEQFYLLNFDQLCETPGQEISRLLDFLEISVGQSLRQQLTELPNRPASKDRYKKYPLSVFTNAQLDAVERLGYPVEL